MTAKHVAEQLGSKGLCICPGFLSPINLMKTADDLDEARSTGKFREAQVGRGDATKGIRSDETCWLDRGTQNLAQAKLWKKIDLLKQAFNRGLFLGLTDFQGHYASYPEGGSYQRHRDCHRSDSNRVVSLIIYLNRDWVSADGGRLRVYADESFQDVDPVGGTLVCFMSRESEHEVLISHKRRASFTGWFLTSR
jgi:SM-20-related protein